MRPAISIGPVVGQGASKYAIYFGDAKANVYAVDAQTGKQLWKRRVEEFFLGRITAAPKLYNGRLYVPVTSADAISAALIASVISLAVAPSVRFTTVPR